MAKKEDAVRIDDDALDESGTEPRVYELGFHLDSNLPTEAVKQAYQEIRDMIAGKGTVVAEGEPQKVQLAYTISLDATGGRRDFDSAYFSWIVYEATPARHAEVVTEAGANKNIIRFIDVLTTKDAARHAVEMRELSEKVPEPIPDAEEALGAELDAALEKAAL